MELVLAPILIAEVALVALLMKRVFILYKSAERAQITAKRAEFYTHLKRSRTLHRKTKEQKVKPNQYINEYIENVFDQRPILVTTNAQADHWLKIAFLQPNSKPQNSKNGSTEANCVKRSRDKVKGLQQAS